MDGRNTFLMPPEYGRQPSPTSPGRQTGGRSPAMASVPFGRNESSPSPVPEDEQPCNESLLNFRPSACSFHLLDQYQRQTTVSMGAQLGGMFFLAECGLGDEASIEPPVAHLTCYRRNLFQVSGSITLSQSLRYIVTDQGLRIPIAGHELVISATESVEGNPVKLISVPWKSAAAAAGSPEESKGEVEPEVIPIEVPMTQMADSSYVAIPFSWKRLQFRIATANNGRRKELQQYFIVRLRLNVILPNGARVGVCDAQSDQVVVRGRSPRNFVTGQHPRKEYAIGGSSRRAARHTPSSSISTSTASSIKSESPATSSLDSFRPGSTQGYQLAPLQHLESSATQQLSSSPYIYEGSASMSNYVPWTGDSSYREYTGAMTPGGSLFSPMAEMALKQSSDPTAIYTTGISSAMPTPTASYPTTSQHYAFSTPTTTAGSSGYGFPAPADRRWG